MFLEMLAFDSQFENCFAWVLSIDYSNALKPKRQNTATGEKIFTLVFGYIEETVDCVRSSP
ncbi:MAG: hypothetical protein Ct9H300mP28_00470 [Pseudomonadota bacterium]|nr:MAG: hypothetical protein Ct9H300mP28_00470 [Pseudomonadota bacterium]